jgi:site-specific recombinase XerD
VNHEEKMLVAAPWVRGLSRQSAAKMTAWWELARDAYPKNSLRAYRSDWRVFDRFCTLHGCTMVPSEPATIADFVRACAKAGRKPATIQRYLATVALVHRITKHKNPCKGEPVRLALKRLTNEVPSAQRQAKALRWAEIQKFIECAGEGIRAIRERALLCVAYDTMARRSELVALNCGDIDFLSDGSGRALIQRSKTDQAGAGKTMYLAPVTVRYLVAWLEIAKISRGALFRQLIATRAPLGKLQKPLHYAGRIGGRLSGESISRIFKNVARHIKMKPHDVYKVSGHSIRVGATQDLLALNIDLASVMQAGRWISPRMPMRYGEHVMAGLGGMARAARAQQRDQ